jgi:hypothetical protein
MEEKREMEIEIKNVCRTAAVQIPCHMPARAAFAFSNALFDYTALTLPEDLK